ncbi:MAG: bifunctional acetyltransferase/tRNA (adenosine(37)-N6)-threonylcarbamoyltransferase complex ATPase subunit type 1 TsaE, partial [Propionibacteriales bacterium]|nr:bifunctional acetyltransferase/tRNA (adenosine(37)-N6)-threonylcarbamoyltransferase complex ATPase subunit type 1 TsaE [Propionibacteriales bacterium]
MTQIVEVDASGADDVLTVIHEAFAGRPTLDPPSTALEETVDSVGKTLAEHGGLLATYAGEPVGAMLFSD